MREFIFLNAWSQFPHLKALTIIKKIDNYPRLLPTVHSAKLFANLVYLHIIMALPGQVFAIPLSSLHSHNYHSRLTFPNLTTLRYTFYDHISEDITKVLGGKCSMPKLRHLYIESAEASQSIGGVRIWEYVQLVGRNLLSLSINDAAVSIPWRTIFIDCPFLTSLAIPCELTELLTNRAKPGLKAIVYTGRTTTDILDGMRRLVREYEGIEILGASHDWDKAFNTAPVQW
jgi:hypothetical protein